MIEHASLREHGALHPAARAPLHIRQAINRARRQAGLPPILGLEDRIAVADPRRDPDNGPCVWVDPAGRLGRLAGALSRGGRIQEPVAYRTSVLLVAGFGLARGHGSPGTVGKRIDRRAFGTADALNASPGWMLKDGHDGAMLSMAGPALRAVASDVLPLVVRWYPDMARADHVALVRRIEAGERAVSARYLTEDRRTMSLPQATDVILRAKLLHVAVLPAGEEAAFPSAFATVHRLRPDTAEELRRQIAAAEKAAAWRATAADAR